MKSIIIFSLLITCTINHLAAQQSDQKVRLAKLVIDPAELDDYKSMLKEEIEASIRLEPGVLTLYAVSEKENPNHITILEIYASEAAYQTHIKSPHFLKYKNSTSDMVRSLELIETKPLIPNMKIKDFNWIFPKRSQQKKLAIR